MRRRERSRRFTRGLARRDVWPWAAAATIAAVSLGLWIGRDARPGINFAGTEFVAGRTEATTVALSDGSFVRLAAGSTVRFSGTARSREAWLTGRAFFGVAIDADRPFLVHTDIGETRVLGTRFEVRQHDDEQRVVVVEGRVAVTTHRGRSVEISKGEVATASATGDFSVATVEDVYALLDWEGGILLFQRTPLGQVVEEVEAHFGVPISLDAALEDRTLTAWFGDDPLEEVVESICLLTRAACEVGADSVRIER